ncbi:hypothetical protein ppKF707_0455 [Metapseudomonas furukawaii]|uniref:Uncharacterized protein n=1 Tax=Metapseudomonas furukawaii TaxID=1149133 RepID=A0AAD1BYM7_METFU|nr:hypothetical protein ppKF707_0455 [Pseudomonas furukawaii]BAU72309.1 hypothetical protein KF707C_6210 [Pseudomonas furukawaii]
MVVLWTVGKQKPPVGLPTGGFVELWRRPCWSGPPDGYQVSPWLNQYPWK